MSEKYLKSAGRNLAEGLGTELCWGWSPAVNFLDVLSGDYLEVMQKDLTSSAGEEGAETTEVTTSGDAENLDAVELVPGSEDAVLFEMGMLEGVELKEARLRVLADRKEKLGGATASGATAVGEEEVEPFRILLCGAADVRHILRTMAALRAREAEMEVEENGAKTKKKRKLRPVHFYLYEPNLRVHCRHLLFLKMICDSAMSLAELEDRVAIFLELYGNSMIRDLTHSYLKQQSGKAIKAWGCGEGPLAKFLDLSEMKNKEKDFVEDQMRHWTRDGKTSQQIAHASADTADTLAATSADASASAANSSLIAASSSSPPTAGGGGTQQLGKTATSSSPSGGDIKVMGLRQVQPQGSDFSVEAQWDRRVRDEMAERYDNRVNIIDWDFNMAIRDYSSQLKFPEYREWRLTGVGYDYARVNPRKGFSYEYTQPNKSLAHFHNKGYGFFVGDVKNGPFWGFGGDSANKHLTKPDFQGAIKVSNGIIAMNNVRAWWYTLLTGKSWPWSEHLFAWDDPKYYNYLPPGTPSDVEHTVQLPDVKFHFIGLSIERFIMRTQHQQKNNSNSSSSKPDQEPTTTSNTTNNNKGFFDACFVGCNSTQFLAPNPEYDFFSLLKPETGALVVETVKFVVDAKKEAKQAFTDKVLEYAGSAGWEINLGKTAKLHENQIPVHKLDDPQLTPGNKEKALKSQTPHQLVLTKKKKVVVAASPKEEE